jgi:kynureninase
VNPLARHYSRFRVTERVLLTGHSHQAWPDVGFEAQQRAWLDAAALVDDKWDAAVDQAARVRQGFAKLLGDSPDNIALGQNTHELVTRWLSALPLRDRRRLVTSDGEFHSIRRQVERLAEERVFDIVRVAAHPVDTLAERLISAVNDDTACVMVSSVLYETAEIVPGLDQLARACRTHGAALLVDAYHHLNAVPFDVFALGLADAFVTGGGYKYCQLGEGNCFLRVPEGCRMRPVLTGWFAEFAHLEQPGTAGMVSYGAGAAAFGGATYDPTSHYRGAAVFDFHARKGLTPERLREINVRQVRLLQAAIESLDFDAAAIAVLPVPDAQRGGFLALRAPRAVDLSRALRNRGVYTDARGGILRLGPAPYLDDRQLRDAAAALGDAVRDAERPRKVD